MEHWIVSNYLGKKLQAYGETVVEFLGMTIWARTTTGKAIFCDWVIEQIYNDIINA